MPSPPATDRPRVAPGEAEIDDMRVTDLLQVAEIERKCFLDPWSLHAFVGEFLNRRSCRLVVRAGPDRQVIAYLIFWTAADEMHINNVAVHPDQRGRGLARQLLQAAFGRGAAIGARAAFLEVRPSNLAARSLYAGLGFIQVGVRRGYYTDNGEDALVLRYDLPVGAREPGALREG